MPLIPQDLVRRQGPAEFGLEIDALGAAAEPPGTDVRAELAISVRDLASDLLERERPGGRVLIVCVLHSRVAAPGGHEADRGRGRRREGARLRDSRG